MSPQTCPSTQSTRALLPQFNVTRAFLAAAIMLALSGGKAAAEEGSGFHIGGQSGAVTKRDTDLMTAPDPRTTEDSGGPKFCHWSSHRHVGSCPASPNAQIGNRCKCPIKTTSGQTELWIQVDGVVRAP